MHNKMMVLYTTFASETEARDIACTLVEEGLAACVNISPNITAIYKWQGQIAQELECAALIKSNKDKVDALITRLKSLHSYDVPVIFTVEPDYVDESYENWLNAELSK